MRKTGSLWQLLQLCRLARDEEGAVLIYVSIALTVFMGLAALVIDGSRLFTVDTEMQSASDALALAGAAELDGNGDAITRATTAMDNLVRNYQTFGNDSGTAITGYTARFLTALPADDSEAINYDDLEATDGSEARFVEVKLQQESDEVDNTRSISTLFAGAIGGGSTMRAGATSVAGFTSAVCKFTPLFICNPYEDTDPSLSYFTSKMEDPKERRKIIALKKSGNGASMFPGNFGFLESDLGNGANALKDSLARVDPGSCFKKDGVETQTGSVNSARHAINTRFDMYDGNFNSQKNSSAYRPARNVTKGYTYSGGNACNSSPSTPPTATAFPRDSVINSNRLGNGVWDFDSYWSINHPGVSKPNGWANTDAARPSRYDVYRWEIDTNHIPNNKASGGENGNPGCNKSAVSDEPDRRILYGAVLNCKALALKGGSAGNVPAVAFIKMFITEPMTKLPGTGQLDEDDTLYTELMGVVEPGIDDEVVHDIVQLYR